MRNEFLELGQLGNAVRDRVFSKNSDVSGAVKEVLRSRTEDAESYFIATDCDILREGGFDKVAVEVGTRLKRLLRKHNIGKRDLILVAGIGNGGMTADSLGTKSLSSVIATEQHYPFKGVMRGLGRIACIAPGVAGMTGINSYDIIESISERVGAKAVIAIDTLSCRQVSRLGSVIQLTDGGIAPGSGVGRKTSELTRKTLGIPVIAVGVPLVIYARNIVAEYSFKSADAVNELGELVVTVKDIDFISDIYADIIGHAINFAVHGNYFD